MNMTETYEVKSYDEAIAILQRLKSSGIECNIKIYTFDFDKNTECHKMTNPEGVLILVEKSKTIIVNDDPVVSHMQLFSVVQTPESIVRKGIMHDVLLLRPLAKESWLLDSNTYIIKTFGQLRTNVRYVIDKDEHLFYYCSCK